MHHGIATAIASDFWIAGEIARNFRSEKQIWPFFIAKCIATATVSLPQRNRNLFPRKNRCVQFHRVNESQNSTANHRQQTVHLVQHSLPLFGFFPLCLCEGPNAQTFNTEYDLNKVQNKGTQGVTRNFLQSLPLSGTPVVQSYWSPRHAYHHGAGCPQHLGHKAGRHDTNPYVLVHVHIRCHTNLEELPGRPANHNKLDVFEAPVAMTPQQKDLKTLNS